MALYIDARVPVIPGEIGDLRPDDAVLLEGDAPAPEGHVVVRLSDSPAPGHLAGCACCVPRSAVGSALSGIFLARGRGEVAYFRRVVVLGVAVGAIRAAIEDDLVASSWFRVP